MKTLGQQVLVLGGFYFIISFLSSLGSGNIFEIFDLIMFITFICLLIILCCKRRYNFLINFQNRFRKIFNYLLGLGIVQYFETIFVTIPGIIYEISQAPVKYLQITNYVYWLLLFIVLILITYRNFIKKTKP